MASTQTKYYVFCGICPNRAAFDIYTEYIKAADGYCHDELQEEVDGTWSIFTRLDHSDWSDYPNELQYVRLSGEERITKSHFRVIQSMSKILRLLSDENPSDVDEDEDEDEDCRTPEVQFDIDMDEQDLYCDEDNFN